MPRGHPSKFQLAGVCRFGGVNEKTYSLTSYSFRRRIYVLGFGKNEVIARCRSLCYYRAWDNRNGGQKGPGGDPLRIVK